jgi:hypothetical protein
MGIVRTVYFCLSSFDNGADINRLLMWDGAVKCLFRFFLRDADTFLFNFIPTTGAIRYGLHYQTGTRHVNKIFTIDNIQPQHTFLALIHKWNSSFVRNKDWPYTKQMHRWLRKNFTLTPQPTKVGAENARERSVTPWWIMGQYHIVQKY